MKTLAGLFVVIALALGQSPPKGNPPTSRSFEVATVRKTPRNRIGDAVWSQPGIGRFEAASASLPFLIHMALGIDEDQIANKPQWAETERYDVLAKPEDGLKLSRDELKPLLQDLLQQRFHLATHYETRMKPGYALVVAKGGPRLVEGKSDKYANYRVYVGPGEMSGLNWSMGFLALMLQRAAGRPVIDKSGVAGNYDIHIRYAPDLAADSQLPSLFTVLRETLGLELRAEKVPVEYLIIDHVDRNPTEN